MSFGILMQQICIIFLEVLLGAVGVLCGKITARDSKFLSDFTMTYLIPASVLSCVSVGGQEGARLVALCVGVAFVLMVVTTFICQGLGKALHFTKGQTAVLIGTSAMPNFGFVGLPLAVAILGSETGLLIGTSCMVAYNIWFFGYVAPFFQKNPQRNLRGLITPCNVATVLAVVMMVLGLKFPTPVERVVSAVSSCTTPIALMIIGVRLAMSDLKALVIQPILYLSTALRGLVFPLLFILVLWLLPLEPVTAMGLAILGSSPAGTFAAVLANQNDVEDELCSQAVAHSTLFMLITIPAILLIAARIFPIG